MKPQPGIQDLALRKSSFTKKLTVQKLTENVIHLENNQENNTGKGQGMDDMYLEIFDLRPQPSHP